MGEVKNIRFAIQQLSLPARVTIDDPPRSAAEPERLGKAFMFKTVAAVGDQQLAINETGGVVSVKEVEAVVLEAQAGGRTRDDINEHRRTKMRKDPKGYPGSKDEAADKKDLDTWALADQPLSRWPAAAQGLVTVALARAVAHEARHQYVEGHSGAGLGADSAALVDDDKNYARFSDDDKGDIVHQMRKLARDQAKATVVAQTFPKGRPFPF